MLVYFANGIIFDRQNRRLANEFRKKNFPHAEDPGGV